MDTELTSCADAAALAAAIAHRCLQARQHGDQWQACCPAHDDHTPSLSITPAADKVLVLSWHAGTWRGELAPEIPGALNWVLTLPDAQMEALLQQTTTLVPSLQATRAQSLVDTNPRAEWANQALLLDARTDAEGQPLAAVNVGRAHKMDQTNAYEHQDRWLYPHYRAWVDDTGGKPLSSRRFTGLLRDLFENQLRLDGVACVGADRCIAYPPQRCVRGSHGLLRVCRCRAGGCHASPHGLTRRTSRCGPSLLS